MESSPDSESETEGGLAQDANDFFVDQRKKATADLNGLF